MAQILSFGFDWSHQPYPIAPKISQMAFAMPLGAFLHNLDLTPETFKGILPIDKGGTGGKTATEARSSLGLGDAATATVTTSSSDTTAGRVLKVGDFGLGSTSPLMGETPLHQIPAGFFRYPDGSSERPPGLGSYDTYGIIVKKHTLGYGAAIWLPYVSLGKQIAITAFSSTQRVHYILRTDQNTMVDSNGFIKAASPIANLFANSIELNDEAKQQQITFERVDRGHYLIKGSSGFAQEGWYIELPKDANGNVKFAVEYQTLENGDIEIKTYKKGFDFETFSIVADRGHPIDIEDGRFISLRLQELPQPEIEDPEEPSLAPADFQPTNLAQAVAEYMEADVPSVLTEQEPAE
ncbi:hypothetical protein [Acinetobacter radioresistens]|jgi:hypothetical protein|uniref:Phage tail protein C-terminal domain-containing protein n=1 Tax=Acinetobacter radioresistens SK82 TaxID=596318 RepID=A0ABP2GJN6_ACIRA|nr:hypothetical protein [Acinetobacter radioresistens]EET81296.1 hypothetical protein ACIRA0001_0077 [Acinetobacter radioresistens SK82]ENV87125.1 hypothetical protein F940_01098 [Acinetobacter radioresistens NIPH 2130]MBA5699751.1 hypothetical protein [Acinetobacter radioresistens]MCK4092638.1 hypothetical protein [Acinetobacter radioresistens]MCK4104642.1 hypothetical protein [Acinetobacter radioresistens]